MYVTSIDKVREYEANTKGASGVKVKYLLHKDVGAKKLQLRLFTIDVGGYTPLEKHQHEHEVFILNGKALLRGERTEVIVKAGDVIFIFSWELHQFKNTGEDKLQFVHKREPIALISINKTEIFIAI